MIAKLITIEEAAARVQPGAMLAIGGNTLYRRPVAFCVALAKRFLLTGEPGNITLFAFTAGYESEMLLGAGLVSTIRSCYFGLEIFGSAPVFTHLANHGDVEILEETEASLAFGLRAQMAGIGFMPGRGWIGTDLPGLRPDVKTVVDPYNGETLMAFPAIKPDFAVIHALVADYEGNAWLGDNKAVDEELSLTSDHVIVTAEEIVPQLDKADIIGPFVQGVVHCPRGAAPTSCHPLYPLDGKTLLDYSSSVSDLVSFQSYFSHRLKEEK